jgi:eukaryotic-like serine/threonine-protein kinase
LEKGPLPIARVSALGRQIASAMAAAHAHGVIHGDLKPGNIMVTEEDVAKIMDFGLARRHAQPSPPGNGAPARPDRGISGTPAYMSPEQARGEPPSPASDVFALGLILYEMITGHKVVTATNLLEAFRLIAEIDPSALAGETAPPFAGILVEALTTEVPSRQITMAKIAEALA